MDNLLAFKFTLYIVAAIFVHRHVSPTVAVVIGACAYLMATFGVN